MICRRLFLFLEKKVMNINLLSANPEDLEDLVSDPGYSLVSNQILREGKEIGFMYRDRPEEKEDSGWRFLSGEEEQDYLDDESNSRYIGLNAMANIDRSIIPLLKSRIGSEFEKIDGEWHPVASH